MCHHKCIGGAMKGVTVLVLVLSLASVLSLEPIPFRVREVTHKAIYEGVGPRIYGGTEAREGQFPFMVFVLMKVGRDLRSCSASLVRPDLVLLAAHCLKFPNFKPNDVLVVGGKVHLMQYVTARLRMDFHKPIDEKLYELQERRGKEFHIHPKYDTFNLHHDVSLLRLNEPFRMLPGSVENISISTEEMKSPSSCTILGWGLTRGNTQNFNLNFVHDRKVSTTKLGCLHKPSGPFICLKPANSGICQGDSGSPLVCDGKVWGVASHFISSTPNPDCGDSLEEYYSELYPDLKVLLPIISAGYRSAAVSFACLSLCLLAVISSGKQ